MPAFYCQILLDTGSFTVTFAAVDDSGLMKFTVIAGP